MAQDVDLEVEIVVAEGILARDEAHALRDDGARRGQSLFARLLVDGRVSDATLASLRALMSRQSNDALSTLSYTADPADLQRTAPLRTDAPAPVPSARKLEVAPSEAFPVPGWDRYEGVRLLGQGGMGRVFLARDLKLKRNVAIKFLRDDDPERAQRVLDEAQAQARVNDERVCNVYEVGEVQGRVYIAMQYIDGRSLSELARELTVEQKAIVIRGAALGVAEAHRVGLIHRDLKPSNILVERGADGELRPFVVDFGLAREWETSTTVTGTVLGTPQFMSPEQARGEVKQLDRRTDVYSLGATLYAALLGRAPIEGTNQLAVLTRISVDEPPAPRTLDRDVPPDLEAITMKCLQKQRADRYDSARALADDLGRFLSGEPVTARSAAGIGYRLRKQLRRHARLVAGVSIVIAIVASAAGYAVVERQRSTQRAELTRRFTERVERIEAMARYSALAPAHDIRRDRERLRQAMDKLAQEVRDGGKLAVGPGHYALGRGYLAFGDHDRAAADLRIAWKSGFREPRVAYALALAEGYLYQRGLRELERISKELRDDRRNELIRRHRDPALSYLRESRGADVPSPEYVAALIAYYEEHYDEALRRLDALDADAATLAWFYESPVLRGEILRARALAYRGTATAQISIDLEASRSALAAAVAIARSDPAVHVAQGEIESAALIIETYGSGNVDNAFGNGVDAAARALAIFPDDVFALKLRASLLQHVAEYKGNQGENVTGLLTRAVADALRAIELAPEQSEIRLAAADIYRYWAQFRQSRSEDPTDQLDRGSNLASSVPPSQRGYEYYVTVCSIHTLWADHQNEIGEDSEHHRSVAIDACANARGLNKRPFAAVMNLGVNYYHRAKRPTNRDAEDDLMRALAAFDQGRAIRASSYVPYFYQGEVLASLAERKRTRAADPTPELTRAIEMYEQGLAVNAHLPHLYNGICMARLQQARDAADRGIAPDLLLEQAEAAASQAVALAPEQGHGYNNRGEVLAQRAAYDHGRGADPRRLARQAEIDFEQALMRTPSDAGFLQNLASIHRLVATYEVEHGIDPGPRVALARDVIARVLARNPSSDAAKRLATELRDVESRWSQ